MGNVLTLLNLTTRCEVMLHDAEAELEHPLILRQNSFSVTPNTIAEHLTEYWNQYWMNAPSELETWDNFHSLLQKLPQHDPICCDLLEDDIWTKAIKSLKSGSARGVDAWSPDELKLLPPKPLTDLKHAFVLLEPLGLPQEMMQARVIPLAKKEGYFSPNGTRPITIIALLYRLWSKIASTIILSRFSRCFPPAITGFLPNRKAQTFLYNLQFQIEIALKTNSEKAWGGLTLDLVKCFNTLQHIPCELILLKLGVPRGVINFWLQSIKKMQRFG